MIEHVMVDVGGRVNEPSHLVLPKVKILEVCGLLRRCGSIG